MVRGLLTCRTMVAKLIRSMVLIAGCATAGCAFDVEQSQDEDDAVVIVHA